MKLSDFRKDCNKPKVALEPTEKVEKNTSGVPLSLAPTPGKTGGVMIRPGKISKNWDEKENGEEVFIKPKMQEVSIRR